MSNLLSLDFFNLWIEKLLVIYRFQMYKNFVITRTKNALSLSTLWNVSIKTELEQLVCLPLTRAFARNVRTPPEITHT